MFKYSSDHISRMYENDILSTNAWSIVQQIFYILILLSYKRSFKCVNFLRIIQPFEIQILELLTNLNEIITIMPISEDFTRHFGRNITAYCWRNWWFELHFKASVSVVLQYHVLKYLLFLYGRPSIHLPKSHRPHALSNNQYIWKALRLYLFVVV